MPEEKILPKDRISASFKQLATVSSDLNDAAKALNSRITTLGEALERLNVGVSAWHRIAGGEDEHGNYWHRDIGYTKLNHTWCIALRRVAGNEFVDESHSEEVWAFTQAPRWMCIEGVGKLPDLFDELIKRTIDTTEKIKARTREAEELAASVSAALAEIGQAEAASKKVGKG